MKSIGLIALDLDETLLDSRKRLSPHNREALVKCARMGIRIVPTTGRAVDSVMEEVRILPSVNYAITANGDTVADLKNVRCLLHRTLANEKTLEILSTADKYNTMYDPYINGRGIIQPKFIDRMGNYGVSSTIQKMVRATRDVVPNVVRYVKECGSDTEEVNIYLGDLEERKTLRGGLGSVEEIVIGSSLYSNLEINAHGATKGNALMRLAGYLSVDKKTIMTFGDGKNDISMIETAGVGVAVGNGLKAVKAAVGETALTNDEDGMAAAVGCPIAN